MTKILVVDDEKKLVDLIKGYLEQESYTVLTAFDGPSALQLAHAANPELVVLDLMLPELDGLEVCRRLRQFSDSYIIMLTARAEEVDKIVGLSVGADDYLTKPFSPRELVARIKARLRRPRTGPTGSAEPADEVFPPPRQVGDLVIDEAQHEVTRNGEALALTTREFALLAMLSRHPGRIFTRSQLLEGVWGMDYFDEHLLEVHIANLRKKLGHNSNHNQAEPGATGTGAGSGYIETVRGLGYRLDKRYAQ
ncbi:MAG: response regulator transcription factor [Chloroflexi bacterium]|nr:response regulator transcription factor [Chloroflexota bacterium]OJV90033.1 MAG: DNA-binding response regulator [Chloroflexi bacterium 54-19]